jgi:hypothetical protein
MPIEAASPAADFPFGFRVFCIQKGGRARILALPSFIARRKAGGAHRLACRFVRRYCGTTPWCRR